MKDLLVVALYALIAIAVLPLVVLALYVCADKLGFAKLADTLLDACGVLLSVQGFTGGVVNLLGGLAICGLGIWAMSHFSPKEILPAVVLIPFGLWRSWQGFGVLRSLYLAR